MKRFKNNGKSEEMAKEDYENYLSTVRMIKFRERHRPLTESEAISMLLRQNVQSITVDDATAVRMRDFYPTFDECKGERVKQGFKFSHEGKLYRTV